MAKQLNIDLNFRANTSMVKSSIMELQTMLSQIAHTGAINVNDAKIRQASQAAKELSIHLNNAFNVNTGKLDLHLLNKSLSSSSQSLRSLSSSLLNVGSTGQQAFIKLAQSVAVADRPVVTLGSKLSNLTTTLANTARWQLSSSMLHGFIGAVQTAYGYAKDLNESLNNIRIVTGYNIEQMAEFAQQANKAAKALSTTTTSYTDAALIFYQQGLIGDEVTKRTDTVIKMANVTGETASNVSDYMTAVWNNFAKGSENLEYYADVMTALGAATASSTDEIAAGLEKFAAVADTVGLSYEYATAALATVTATTRQSADVVGTAFKTLFARIQDLKLGETLDDGTTLGSYSEALAKAGINIKDTAGELKNMDVILEEMASKWDTLGQAEKTALAQSVAGVRQYTQLIALMDNWDFMQDNLKVTADAKGTLQEQADIYAESWDAASNRVRASLETIYSQILKDDFFISIANGFSSLLDSVSTFIDGIGGIKGIIIGLGSVFLNVFANKIQPALNQLKTNFEIVFMGGDKSARRMAEEMSAATSTVLQKQGGNLSATDRVALENATQMSGAKNKLLDIEKQLTPLEKQRYETELAILELEQKELAAAVEENTKKKESVNLAKEELQLAEEKIASLASSKLDVQAGLDVAGADRDREEIILRRKFEKARTTYQGIDSTENLDALNAATKALHEHQVATEVAEQSFENFLNTIQSTYASQMELYQGDIPSEPKINIGASFEAYATDLETLSQSAQNGNVGLKEIKASLSDKQSQLKMASGGTLDLSKDFENLQTVADEKQLSAGIDGLIKKLRESEIPAKDLEATLKRLGQGKYVANLQKGYADVAKKTKAASKATEDYAKDTDELAKRQERVNAAFKAFKPEHKIGALEAITKTAGGLGQVAMAATSLRSAFSALANEDLSFGEKLTTFIMGMSMAIPSLISGITAVKTGFVALTGSLIPAIVARKAYNAIIAQEITAETMATIVQRMKNGEDRQSIANDIAMTMVKKGLIKEGEKEAFILALNAKLKKKENQLDREALGQKLANNAATLVEKLVKMGLLPAKYANITATVAETAANYGLQTSMLPVLIITLAITAAILALVAIIWIIVSAVQALSDAYNADAIAAEKAKAVAEDLAESYKAIKQEYEDMVSAMEEYKTARDALDNLTEGTREWYDALRKANEQAIELMNTYPTLHKYATNENGLIVISDAGLDYVAQQKLKDVNTSYSASLIANANATRAQTKADITQFRRDTFGDVAEKTTGYAIGQQLAIGDPGINTLFNAISAGDIGVTMAKNIKGDDATKAALKIAETNSAAFATLDEFRAAMDDQGVQSEALITSLYKNKEALLEMRDSLSAYEAQLETAIAESVNMLLQQNSAVQSSKYANDIREMVQDNYSEAYNEAYKKYLNQASSRGIFNTGTAESEAAMAAYAEIMKLDDKTGFTVDDYTGDGTIEYSYIENGDTQEKVVTAEEIATILATKEAEGYVNQIATEFARFTNEMNESQVRLLAALQSGKYENLSEKAMLEADDIETYLSGMGLGIDDLVNPKGDEDVRKEVHAQVLKSEYGIDIDKWQQAMQQARDENAQIKDEVLLSLGQTTDTNNAVLTEVMDNLSVSKNKHFANAISDLVDFFDEEAGQELIDIVNNFAQELDPISAKEFYKQFGQITDYADATQWEKLAKAMEESGDLTEAETKALDRFIDESKDAAKAIKSIDMDAFIEQLKNLSSILDKLANREIDFSDKEFEALQAAGVDTSSFVKTLDGFRYLGDVSELTAEIAQAAEDNVRDVQENYENISERLEQAKANTETAKADLEKNVDSQVKATTKIKSLWTMISEWFESLWSRIQTVFGAFIERLSEVVLKIYDGIVAIWNWAGEKLTNVWNKIISGIASLYNIIVDLLANVGIDMEKWKYTEATFDRVKTSEEIQVEEEFKKRQEQEAELEAQKEAEQPKRIESILKSAQTSSVEKITDDYNAQVEKIKGLQESLSQIKDTNSSEYKAVKAELDREMEILEAWDDALLSKAAGYKDLQPLIGRYQKAIKNGTEAEKEEARESLRMAIRLEEAQKNFDASAKYIGDYAKALRTAGKDTVAFKQNLIYLQTELGNFFGENVDDIFTEEWVVNNLDNLKAFANGEQSGIDAVVDAFTTAKIASSDFATKYGLDAATITNITGILNDLKFDINGNADMSQVINALMAAGMTAEQVASFLQELGYTNIKYDVDTETLSGITDAEGNPISVKLVSSIDAEGYAPIHTGVFSGNTYRSGGNATKEKKSDSGESKNTSDARKDKSETVERYKEINDKLDDSSRAMDKASKAADRLYGASRLKALDKLNEALKEEIKNLEAKKKQTEEYLALDREALDQAAAETGLGIKFEYDENGNITNYDEMMTIIHNAREALLDSFGDTIDEDEQKQLDAFDKKAENVVNKQEQYDDTREEKEDVEDDIEDAYNQWQDNNYEKLSYKLELKLEINDMDLEMIELKLDQISDDVFKAAEGAELIVKQFDIYQDTAGHLMEQQNILAQARANGDISQEAYVNGLKDIYSQTLNNMQALQDLDKAMMEYYGNTLNMAAEEIAKYTESMEHQTSVLDHYSSLLNIMGESGDYDKMGTMLKAKAKTLEDQVAVSKSAMEMYQDQANEAYKKWQNADNDAAAELLKKEYEAALKAAETAEEEFLSKSEEWAEALKAVLENALKGAAKDLEKALTDGASFDALATQMERASSLQEEYLTTTNKIYETNKMINTAQQAIDKTTNTVAKQRLANFQKETAQLQNKRKLSQYELDIQQAKYDLLLAEIALEEAQNAKSTVRLQRDSEGNFGYVYTADQNQIADAQQKMLDAENALYNKGLEGANDYAQKYQQTMQEMYDTLTEIQDKYLNGEYDSYQEYQDAMIEAQDYYYQKLEDYSDLYKIAISTDNKVIADAWSSNFNDMVFNTEQWKVDVARYVGEVSGAFKQWKTDLDNLKLKTELDDLAGKTKEITTESDNLRKTLIGEDGKSGVVGALGEELTKVGEITLAYGTNRAALQLLNKELETYAGKIKKAVEEESKLLMKTPKSPETPAETKSQDKTSTDDNESDNTKSGGNEKGDKTANIEESTEPKELGAQLYVQVYTTNSLASKKTSINVNKHSRFKVNPSTVDSDERDPNTRAPIFFHRIDDPYSGLTGYITSDSYQKMKKTFPTQFDTGGYTGSWGNEGKLAMLHEKELILNAQDTSNFLASLEVLREIMKTIDLHSSYAQISGMLSSPIYRDYNEPQILEQQVHIEASFPGVQDRNEIEEAFNNLINRATQFVNRK